MILFMNYMITTVIRGITDTVVTSKGSQVISIDLLIELLIKLLECFDTPLWVDIGMFSFLNSLPAGYIMLDSWH